MGAIPRRLLERLVVRRRLAVLALVLGLGLVMWYLRDPPWLIGQTTGLRAAQRAADGTLYRWSGGHASFFAPADAGAIRVPLATTFDQGDMAPMMVTVFVDDERAARIVLTDDAWQVVTVPLPPRGSRRVRRIDIRTSVVRDDNHGVKIGEIGFLPPEGGSHER
jgi:hypothetical protein